MNVTKLKITLGYLLLLAVLMFLLLFVHREVKILSAADSRRDFETDSLLLLLHQKDNNTIQMLREFNKIRQMEFSPREIEEIIVTQDSIVTQKRITRRVITRQDSLISSPPQKKFFKRLAEAFAPSKGDSARLVNSSVELRVDTIIEPSTIVDSLHQRLRTATQQKQTKRALNPSINKRYRQRDTQLTLRIDSLVATYKRAFDLRLRQEAEAGDELRQRSTRVLAAIAVGAVLLAAFFLVLVLRDIARSMRYRRALEIANQRANDLLQAREKMMLTITHDFKAPLSSILGYVDLLSDHVVDSQQSVYLENMRTSSQHLFRLVTDLLDFHRLDLRKEAIQRATFHPSTLFEEVQVAFAPLASKKGILLKFDLDEALQGTFISDPLRIRQILNNLLSNAIKFTPRGSVTLTAQYVSSKLILQISDTGIGMASDDCKRIFHEFTRLPSAQGEEGFGLGLSIVHKLVMLLEGTISVDSSPNQGSIFTVVLPFYPVQSNQEAVSPQQQEAISTPLPQSSPILPLHVLLIDDDRIQLTLTAAQLAQSGITSVCCQQLDELIEALRTQTFDLLLSDVQMPAINGFDLLRLLRSSNMEQARTIPIVAVTARSEVSIEEYRAHGFMGVLRKPFTVDELRSIPLFAFRLQNLTAFAGDDKEAALHILRSFIEETQKDLARFEAALASQDIAQLAAIAHKLLPLITLIEAAELVSLLTLIEACREQKTLSVEMGEAVTKAISLLRIVISTNYCLPLHR